MQTVFCFVEDFVCMSFKHLSGDFFLTVCRQAVENHCAGTCSREYLVIDLEACKSLASFDCFAFLTHRSPDVGFENVCIGCHLFDIVADAEVASVLLSKCHDVRMRVITFRACNRDFHTNSQCADDQRVCHIVAVADVAEIQAVECTLIFTDGHQVSQNLTGMCIVGQAVDNRDAAETSQIFDFLLFKGTDHNTVEVTGEYAGSILNRFAAADLQVTGGEELCEAAQLVHTGFERNTGTGGGFLEDHTEGFAFQQMMGNTMLLVIFELIGEVEDIDDFFLIQISHFQKMFGHDNASFHTL